MADAPDSKSGDGDIVRVQVPPPAPNDPNLSGRRVRIFDWNRCSRFDRFYGFNELASGAGRPLTLNGKLCLN